MANTKGKKMTEVVSTEPKEVGFNELELKIAKPSLAQDKTMIVSGNFDELSTKIKAVVAKYKDTQLTDENFNYVKTLKGQFTTLRTGIERERKEWKKLYIQPASKMIDAMCDDLQQIVAEGETSLANQLDAYDQKRKDELTEILKEYIADSVKKHGLREEYASQIQLKDKYYNKTQNEEDSADDIEAQASELEKKMREYDSSVALIKEECDGTMLLVDNYISQLSYKSAMEIILQIKIDKKKSAELYADLKAKEESGEKITLGESTDELREALAKSESIVETEYRERVLRVRYLPNQAKLMAKFFKDNNIEFEFLNK